MSRELDLAMIEPYMLGVVVDPVQPDHQPWAGRLTIPYITPTGVVGLKARCIVDHDCKEQGCAKYYSEHGVPTGIYNTVAFLAGGDAVVVTEGELDAATVEAWLGLPAVGIPGTSGWRPHYALCFEGYREVIVVADGDEPGRKAAEAIAKQLTNARIAHMPDGMDSNSLLTAKGPDALAELLGVG